MSASYVTAARRAWPQAVWITGNGPYASVSHCPHGPESRRCTTVMLFPTREGAEGAKREIDEGACGGQCCNDHHLVDLDGLT